MHPKESENTPAQNIDMIEIPAAEYVTACFQMQGAVQWRIQRGFRGFHGTPLSRRTKNAFDQTVATCKAEKHAAGLKCKINLPTLTVRVLKA